LLIKRLLFISLVITSFNVKTSIDDYFEKKVHPNSSNYGLTGILELPNARFMQEASLRFSFSSSFPNEYTSITGSPFNWFEANYRYAEVKNLNYGPSFYSGNQSWKDKGFDVKFRLLSEKYYFPSVALGLRDLAGTGAFSSEYIVGTKAIGNFDITLGLGWGSLGSEATFGSPFKYIHDGFEKRNSNTGQGGSFNFKDWFSGDAAILSGVEYDLKKYGLRFKLEYDTTNPDQSSFNPLPVKSRFNFGMSYFLADSLNLGLAFERGDQFRLSFNLTGDFLNDNLTKAKPKNVIKLSEETALRAKQDRGIFYRSLNMNLRQEEIYIQGATYNDDSVEVVVASSKYAKTSMLMGRTSRIVSALADKSVKEIKIDVMNGDFEVATLELDREEFDKALEYKSSVNEILESSKLISNSNQPSYLTTEFQPTINFPQIDWRFSPAVRHQIGGPEGFYLGQLWLRGDASIKLRRGLTIHSTIGFDIYNTFNDFINTSQSRLPHVRSDIQFYLDQGKNNIEKLKLEYMFSPRENVFVRADFGLLEQMFGGYGGEVLYRPFEKEFYIGFTLHRVKQRGYKQRFDFLEYATDTGHLSLYYDFPYGISSHFKIGRYLAKDKGFTLDLSRRFKTGFTIGAFASKTNIPSELFGEGSFDKGFYFSVPLDLFYTDYRASNISFGIHPLTKDGAASLSHHNSLHSILADSNKSSILRDWEDLLK